LARAKLLAISKKINDTKLKLLRSLSEIDEKLLIQYNPKLETLYNEIVKKINSVDQGELKEQKKIKLARDSAMKEAQYNHNCCTKLQETVLRTGSIISFKGVVGDYDVTQE
jgi:hypothetical protein